MNKLLPVLTAAVLVSCGPSTADLSSAPMEAETAADDIGTSTGELVSNRSDFWFPMQEGNSWTFEKPTGEVRKVTFEGVYDGIGYMDGLITNGRWMGTSKTAPNSFYSWIEATNTWEPFIRFGYAVTSWDFGAGACNAYTVKRGPAVASVKTPAGTFTGTRTIVFDRKPSPTARCQPPSFTELTFAPGVGLIAIDTYDGKFFLTQAVVNGKAIPAASTIKGSLKLDKAIYVNKPNTIVCITTPCPGNAVTAIAKATYTVTNQGTKSQTFQFNTGCQFDIQLVDDKGTTARSLSANQFCTQSLTNFTLAPNASKTFTADVPLENAQGQLLGNFTAMAHLKPTNGASTAESAASFIVNKQ
jgi:hypothetical protein